MNKVTLTALLIFLVNHLCQAQCHIDDWTALKALYESTDGDNWINRDGWDQVINASNPSECSFWNVHGIHHAGGRVGVIGLGFNNLNGNIPPEIGDLALLGELLLYGNRLLGLIPNTIGNLQVLYSLRLEDNNLSGKIPAALGDLSSLRYLDLSNNNFSGMIPPEIGNLTSMGDMRIKNNLLSGSIPANFGNLESIVNLDLHNNRLTGSIPAGLGNLSNLVFLYLNFNRLSGNLPNELAKLDKLEILHFDNNNFSGCYPKDINSFCEINYIDIDGGNNFQATWEDFCTTGAGTCEQNENEITVTTNYSGNVAIKLNNKQNILKNNVATVYDYSTCTDYTNLSNCTPVEGLNNLSANEALWTVTKAAEYFSTHHNITIPPINIIVNNTTQPNNAKYNSANKVIVLGNGDGVERNSMSAPDIVAHEYAHAIINNINYLGNYKISGALNESYADIFGELIEHYCYGTNDDWILGDKVMIDAVNNPKGLRNLSYPSDSTMKYILPDTYKGEHWIHIDNTCFHEDYCGIHTNSGVHSYWFYLVANGADSINGIGIDKAANIILDNLKHNLNPTSTFIDVRAGTIKSAETLYPNQPNILATIIQAWDAVGVYDQIENPVEFTITNAAQIDEESIDEYKTLMTIEFDLNIDSLGMDISADELCFNLHFPSTYQSNELCIKKVYEPLTIDELTTTITNGKMNICINRINLGMAKQGNIYPKIASKSAIIQFVVPIVAENLKGESTTIEPFNISGYTKTGNNEWIDFKPATLYFGTDFDNDAAIESQSLVSSKFSLKLNHKNCNSLGLLKVEVFEDMTAGPPFTYRLKDAGGYGNVVEEVEGNSTMHQFYNLEEGAYKLIVEDGSNNVYSKKFSLGFVSEPIGSQCCADNLIIPPGSVKGTFNSNGSIIFSKGTSILEGAFEICDY